MIPREYMCRHKKIGLPLNSDDSNHNYSNISHVFCKSRDILVVMQNN